MDLTRIEIIELLDLVSKRIEDLESVIKRFENDIDIKVMFLDDLEKAKNIKIRCL